MSLAGASIVEAEQPLAESSSPDEEDGVSPQLSVHALAALQEFYIEQQQSLMENSATATTTVSEDWQLSQFWYDEETTQILADETIRASQDKRIACISCPTLFSKILQVKSLEHHVVLLEYDTRFQVHGKDFVHYDYRQPRELPATLEEGSFDVVIADPPFLSEECLTEMAQTIKFLSKDKVILCTGAVMEELAWDVLGVKATKFIPGHRHNLANAFKCYINYVSPSLHF